MKNETKLKKLIAWLDDNGIEHYTPYRYRKTKNTRHTALVIIVAKNMIANVKLENENNEKWFKKHRRFSPIFIRENETPKFILEKVQDVIIRLMQKAQARTLLTARQIERSKKKKERRKRKNNSMTIN